MSVKIRDTLTPEGKEFMKQLRELQKLEVRVGFEHGKKKTKGGKDIADIAAWNELGTSNGIPSRPFMRNSVDNNVDKINAFFKEKKQDLLSGKPARQILNELGLFQKDLIQEQIMDGSFVANAASTIKKKGSDHPLIDKGQLMQSVNYVIKPKGEGGE